MCIKYPRELVNFLISDRSDRLFQDAPLAYIKTEALKCQRCQLHTNVVHLPETVAVTGGLTALHETHPPSMHQFCIHLTDGAASAELIFEAQ